MEKIFSLGEYMRSLLLMCVLVCCAFVLLFFGIYSNDKDEKQQPKEKCISERALQGCEQAGFDVERQLERCLWAFEKCVQTNGILQERLKEKE